MNAIKFGWVTIRECGELLNEKMFLSKLKWIAYEAKNSA